MRQVTKARVYKEKYYWVGRRPNGLEFLWTTWRGAMLDVNRAIKKEQKYAKAVQR